MMCFVDFLLSGHVMKTLILLTASALSFGGQTFAGDFTSDRFFMMPNAGTLGAGIEAGYSLNDNWRARIGINRLKTSFVYHDKNADLHNSLDLLSGGMTVDYFPTASNFYLSGGLRLSANSIKGSLKNLSAKSTNGSQSVQLFIEDPLTRFSLRQNAVQPYLGTGYSRPLTERITFNLDLGALYAGTPELSVRSRATQFGFTRDQIRRETERQKDRLSSYKFLPVAQIGFKFNF